MAAPRRRIARAGRRDTRVRRRSSSAIRGASRSRGATAGSGARVGTDGRRDGRTSDARRRVRPRSVDRGTRAAGSRGPARRARGSRRPGRGRNRPPRCRTAPAAGRRARRGRRFVRWNGSWSLSPCSGARALRPAPVPDRAAASTFVRGEAARPRGATRRVRDRTTPSVRRREARRVPEDRGPYSVIPRLAAAAFSPSSAALKSNARIACAICG